MSYTARGERGQHHLDQSPESGLPVTHASIFNLFTSLIPRKVWPVDWTSEEACCPDRPRDLGFHRRLLARCAASYAAMPIPHSHHLSSRLLPKIYRTISYLSCMPMQLRLCLVSENTGQGAPGQGLVTVVDIFPGMLESGGKDKQSDSYTTAQV
jgi:hypothetical protein